MPWGPPVFWPSLVQDGGGGNGSGTRCAHNRLDPFASRQLRSVDLAGAWTCTRCETAFTGETDMASRRLRGGIFPSLVMLAAFALTAPVSASPARCRDRSERQFRLCGWTMRSPSCSPSKTRKPPRRKRPKRRRTTCTVRGAVHSRGQIAAMPDGTSAAGAASARAIAPPLEQRASIALIFRRTKSSAPFGAELQPFYERRDR